MKARSFIEVARSGLSGSVEALSYQRVHVTPHRFVLWEDDGPPSHYKIEFDEGEAKLAYVRSDSGLVTAARCLYSPTSQVFDVRHQISIEGLKQLASKYHKAAGWPENQWAKFVVTTEVDPRITVVHAYPSFNDVAYHWSSEVYLHLDYATGQLLEGSWPRIPNPSPPDKLVPEIDNTIASQSAFQFVSENFGVAQGNVTWNQLCIWRVKDYLTYKDFNANDLDLQRRGVGKLVYDVFVLDNETGKDGRFRYQVIVDAADGRIVTAYKEKVTSGIGSGEKAPGPFTWNVQDQSAKVSQGQRTVYSGPASIDFVKFSQPRRVKGQEFVLTIGHVAARATFDPVSGLLVVKTGERLSWRRPSADLDKALRKRTT